MFTIQKVMTDTNRNILVHLANEIWREHFTSIIGEEQVQYMLDMFLSYNAIIRYEAMGYEYYLMYENQNVCGFMAIEQQENKMFLSKLYIHKKYRSKGYARQALDFIETETLQRNLNEIWLTCNKYNDTTLKIYDKMGFSIFDEAVNDIGNGYVMDDYYLHKTINKTNYDNKAS